VIVTADTTSTAVFHLAGADPTRTICGLTVRAFFRQIPDERVECPDCIQPPRAAS
jgi:hypothetical protein